MKISLIGYGKMGHAIERMALSRGHEVVCRIDADNTADFDSEAFASSDVAIEFSTPATAVKNYSQAWNKGVKVVSGTTGWLAHRDEVMAECARRNATLLWSSNFSLGVNVFFTLNRYLASLMGGLPQYTPSITEIHHIHKLDHPSGTAITLAEGVMDRDPNVTGWTEEESDVNDGHMKVTALREGEVPGTHTVTWKSPIDEITITHRAFSRDGFALGAVMAAEWVATGQSGWLTIDQFMESLLPNSQLLKIVH